MPPPIAGLITSVAAALCYTMCVSESSVKRTVETEDDIRVDMTGEQIDVRQDVLSTVSSVGASTVLQEAAQDGFFGNNCFLEISPDSTDNLDGASSVVIPVRHRQIGRNGRA